MLGDHTFNNRLGNLLAHSAAVVVNQRGRGTKPRTPPPRWDVLHPAHHHLPQRLIGIVAARVEPSMRPHAGLAAKAVDVESPVVGERRGSRALEIKARLDKRVLLEGRARFLRHGGYSSLGERYEIQVETSQQQKILSEFRWIGRRDQQPSHRYLVAALSRRFRRRYPRFFRLIRNLERGAFAILLERQLNQPID